MRASEWIRHIVLEHDREDEGFASDFMAIGERLGKDRDLSEADYEVVLKGISKKLFANSIHDILDCSLEYRAVPSEDFFVELILSSWDWEIGGKCLPVLMPYFNLTAFVSKVLSKTRKLRVEEQKRISSTVRAACCVTTLSVPTGDVSHSKDAVDAKVLSKEIRRWMPYFRMKYDLDNLNLALKALGRPPELGCQ